MRLSPVGDLVLEVEETQYIMRVDHLKKITINQRVMMMTMMTNMTIMIKMMMAILILSITPEAMIVHKVNLSPMTLDPPCWTLIRMVI